MKPAVNCNTEPTNEPSNVSKVEPKVEPKDEEPTPGRNLEPTPGPESSHQNTIPAPSASNFISEDDF